MAKKIVTLGEVMMRLSPAGSNKLTQVNTLEINYGGTEANVSVSLAHFGMEATHVSRFADDMVGRAVEAHLLKNRVNTQFITFGQGPQGIYFLEAGALQRASRTSFNRAYSAFTHIQPEDYDWDAVFDGADWFHWTAVTPGISASACQTLIAALDAARKHKVTVSGDLNIRSNMWKWGKTLQEVIPELIEKTDVLIGGWYDIRLVFAEDLSQTADPKHEGAMWYLKHFPNLKYVCDKTRNSINASHQIIQGHIWDRNNRYNSRSIELVPVIDRIGTGDAYAAGLIYGMLHMDLQQTVEFANAACALKHTIPGDVNLASLEEVLQLAGGDGSGMIVR